MLLPSLLRAVIASICLGSTMAQEVTQDQPATSVVEKKAVTLDCVYKAQDTNYALFWYKQPPSGEMIFLVRQESYNKQNATEGRYSLNFQKEARFISLTITASQLRDSAVYFCALNRGDNRFFFGSGTKLSVKPNIQDPNPSVYQLRGSKSSNTSVCLFTDFDSKANVSHGSDPGVFGSGQTVVDMKSTDSKSNGALAWSNNTGFECNYVFGESTDFYSSSETSCDAKLTEKSFETDANLNFQNLYVIGLRILLLKVAGFNLLMTLRLWSS